MNKSELTPSEKTTLLSSLDHHQPSSYDESLYQVLKQAEPPFPHEVDDPIRRAISKYIRESWDELRSLGVRDGNGIDATAMGAMTEMLFIGYGLGRSLQKPLFHEVNKS